MPSVLFLFALFALSFADNPKCPVTVDDSYFLKGQFYGSAYNSTSFYSLIGMYDEAIYYDVNTPSYSMLASNASIIITNGVDGSFIAAGWIWYLLTGSGVYSVSHFNGEYQQCQLYDAETVPQLSAVVSNLYQIYPFSNELYKMSDGSSILCQGLSPDMNGIIAMEFTMEYDCDTLATFISTQSNSSSIMTDVLEMRPLQSSDGSLFYNPCSQAEATKKRTKMHHSLHERFKELLPS